MTSLDLDLFRLTHGATLHAIRERAKKCGRLDPWETGYDVIVAACADREKLLALVDELLALMEGKTP